MAKVIVVHSSSEVDLYANTFHLPRSRFVFVPYCVRRDALTPSEQAINVSADKYILAAGRHRDFGTFINALRDTPFRGVIIGGLEDKDVVFQNGLPPNIEAHFEIPFQQYRAWIAGADIFVVPLFSDRIARSLGQIATFEAVAHRIPVVAARTFQLTDYFKDEDEVLFYEPGSSQDLRKQIECLMSDQQLKNQLTRKAYRRMIEQYTDEQYTKALLSICST